MRPRPSKSRKKTRASSLPDYWFDRQAANRACEFFDRYIVHIKGEMAGRPFHLERWQRRIVRRLFGWKRRSNGFRRYRTVFVEVPRGNGKSTLAAGVALYLLFSDGEPGAEVYSAAADRDQAAIVFEEQGKKMVEASPALRKRCDIFKRSIVVPPTNSSFKVLSSDVPTKHGFNVHGCIFDELHAQPNRYLFDVLKTGMGKRRQPVMFIITTAGEAGPSIWAEQHEYAEKILAGSIRDDTWLPVIYAANREDDWTSEKVWKRVNPNYGISVNPDFVRQECREAQEKPAYENTFKRLQLNIRTDQVVKWMSLHTWDACAGPVDPEELAGQVCFAGMDLANNDDLASFVLVFPPDGDERPVFSVLPFFWVPEDNIAKRVRRDRVHYDVWVKQGFLNATPGNIIDYDAIRLRIKELGQLFSIQEIAFDPWNATQIANQLGEQDGFQMVQFRQGFQSMSAPTKELERLVLGKLIAHAGHPVLRWNLGNMVVKVDPAKNIKPDKGKAREKIDGIVATIMAIGRASLRVNTASVYETRGLRTL